MKRNEAREVALAVILDDHRDACARLRTRANDRLVVGIVAAHAALRRQTIDKIYKVMRPGWAPDGKAP